VLAIAVEAKCDKIAQQINLNECATDV